MISLTGMQKSKKVGCVTAHSLKVDQIPILDCLLG